MDNLVSEYFLHSGYVFEAKVELRTRTEAQKYTVYLYMDGDYMGCLEGKHIEDGIQWLKDNFYRYIQ